jgi:hypothetical protein
LTNILTLTENTPIDRFENRPIEQLVHHYEKGKRIRDIELGQLSIKIFEENGRGITYKDIMKKFSCSQEKAQRRLKNACIETLENQVKKTPVLFRAFKRTNPQQFYPYSKREKIIDKLKKKKYRPNDPTVVRLYSNPYLEKLKARSVMELLSILQNQPIYIHKPSLKINLHKDYYKDIDVNEITEGNKSKDHEEIIGQRNVKYEVYPCGTIMIYITCSNKPFKLEVGEDVSSFFVFLGQVKDRLVYFLRDFSEQAIPPVMDWILVQCDINKDIGINIVEELSLPDLQLRIHDRIFRLYVNSIDGSTYYRTEESRQVNQVVGHAIPEIMKLSNSNIYSPSKYNYIQ